MIVEIAIDVPAPLLRLMICRISDYLESQKIPYYIEPPQTKYQTLDELEADCEGK